MYILLLLLYAYWNNSYFLQNLIDINDNVYSPQNEVAFNILDDKKEVNLIILVVKFYVKNYITHVCTYVHICPGYA